MRMRIVGVLFILLIGILLCVCEKTTKVDAEAMTYIPPQTFIDDELLFVLDDEEEPNLPPIETLSCVTYVGAEPVKAWDDIPLDYEEQVALYDKCEELGISFWFMLALLESESNYKADAVGDHGKSVGYMQINKCNWERMKKQYNLDVNVPIDNMFCGCVMVKELMDKYDTLAEVIMGYKCGEARMKKLIKQGTILKSVEKVTNRAIELENAHREEQ